LLNFLGSDATLTNANTTCPQPVQHQSPIRALNLKRLAPIEKMSNIISSSDYVESHLLLSNNTNAKPNQNFYQTATNQLSSFFASCSSLDHSLTLTTTTTTNPTDSTTSTTTATNSLSTHLP
jgi:hypothetical protein